jgi:hypothetical protein
MTKLKIGGRCETLWREAYRRKEDAAIAEATFNVRDDWDAAQAVPVRDRGRWLKQDYAQHRRDVEESLKEDQGTSHPKRFVTIRVNRPKGQRATIIKQAAEEFAEEFGVSERMVRACWQEFRRFEKEV